MEEKDLQFFKNLLTRQLEELLDHAGSTFEGLIDPGDNLPDPIDRASFDSDRSTILRIRDRESMLINKIRKSLKDIENGDYGICEDCGEEISIERLKARPVARHCIDCKTKREALEKMVGA